jgi:hypothetical protein
MEDFPSLDLVEATPTLTPDDLYWELDDTNPIEEEDFITTPTPTEQPIIKKIVSRNVGNSRRRRFR